MTQTKHVLVVEDDQFVQDVLCASLEAEYETVFRARNGAQALRYLHGQTIIDFSLIDIHLPDLDGLALAAEAAKIKIPSLMMTGDFEKAGICRSNGICCLTKPFHLNALHDAIAQLNADNTRNIESISAAWLKLRAPDEERERLTEQG